jgi:hypothetical protein
MNRATPNSLFDPNLDEQLMYQADIDNEWEELMAGGPTSINYMGSIMAVASKKDFPLSANYSYTLVK